MSFLDHTLPHREVLEARLTALIPQAPRSLYDPVRYVVEAGGKRVRPMLTALCYELTRDDDGWLDAAIAIELLHTFTLVHDDIMDSAATRRGHQTVHAKFGINDAILSGDVMIALAQRSLAQSNSEHSAAMLAEFGTAFIRVCEGQAYDKEFETKSDVSIDDYINMIDLKTAKVLEAAAVLGSIAAGSLAHVEPLRTFAHHVGIAFQIQDDLLDLTADHAAFGKTIGGDILEGKRTFLLLKLIERKNELSEDEQSRIGRILSREAISNDIAPIRESMQRLGVLDETAQAVQEHTSLALSSLESIDADRSQLRDFAEFLLKRSH